MDTEQKSMPEKASSSALAEVRLRGEDRMGEPALRKEAERVWLSWLNRMETWRGCDCSL